MSTEKFIEFVRDFVKYLESLGIDPQEYNTPAAIIALFQEKS